MKISAQAFFSKVFSEIGLTNHTSYLILASVNFNMRKLALHLLFGAVPQWDFVFFFNRTLGELRVPYLGYILCQKSLNFKGKLLVNNVQGVKI